MSVIDAVVPRVDDDALPPPPRRDWPILLPTIVTAVNAVAFLLVRPDVNDLWAARARASAVSHGVGLFYWFGWFGGATPGNYSVLTPGLCALIGTELVGALAAVALIALATLAVRDTRHPHLAAAFACLATVANLWSGRIPFLLGAPVAVGAVIAVRAGRRRTAVAASVLSVLVSPVAGAFLGLGLSGTFLTTRTKEYRPIIGTTVGVAAVALVAAGLVFGTPGPEPFEWLFALEVLGALILLRLAAPPDHLRTTLAVVALATVALWAIPNGLGSNISRLVLFCLPVAVVAMSALRVRLLAALMVPLVLAGWGGTVLDLVNAERPVSSAQYYARLARVLDRLPGLRNCRVEVVDHGAHTADAVLLDHALLARGWETQSDTELNDSLNQDSLDATTYKVWLDNNAVCYVALPTKPVKHGPEYDLVEARGLDYLTRVWADQDWQLYRVSDPTPIVGAPAHLVDYSQASMTLEIPCACTINVRIRWSDYLEATLQPVEPSTASPDPDEVAAEVRDDGAGWTSITTDRPGRYALSGNLGGLLN